MHTSRHAQSYVIILQQRVSATPVTIIMVYYYMNKINIK